MLWGNNRPGCLGWNGFPTRGKKECGQTDRMKERSDRPEETGWEKQGWVFGFLIKIEVPPTHTLKEYVADTT